MHHGSEQSVVQMKRDFLHISQTLYVFTAEGYVQYLFLNWKQEFLLLLWAKYKSIKMRFCQMGGQVLITLPTIQWPNSLFRFTLDLSIQMENLEVNWHYCY